MQIRSHAQKFFSKVERLKEEGEGEQGEPSSGSSSKMEAALGDKHGDEIHAGRTRCCGGIQVTRTNNLEGTTCSSLHQAC